MQGTYPYLPNCKGKMEDSKGYGYLIVLLIKILIGIQTQDYHIYLVK